MFDFLIDNPVAAIFLLFFLYRLFFGNKKKTQGEQKEQARGQQVRAAATDRKKSFQERLEEALKATQGAAGLSAQVERNRPMQPVPPSTLPTAKDDPFAFHSLTETVRERVDYDLNAPAFNYNAAVNEPVEQEYHLTGFSEFHEAHGISATSPIMSVQAETEAPVQSEDLFNTDGDLRRAIILNEILGPPRAMRRLGS